MFKKFLQPIEQKHGFTLVEMIGVLAIIAILIALLLPRVFQLVNSANARSLVAAARTYETAIVNYFGDIGSILSLSVAGIPTAENTGDTATVASLPNRLMENRLNTAVVTAAGQWPRFGGPYIDAFNSANPPGVGATMVIPSRATNGALGAATTFAAFNFDLNGDGNNDLAPGSNLAYLEVRTITQQQFSEVDAILDSGIGGTPAQRQLWGKVKWRTNGGGQMRIYLASQ